MREYVDFSRIPPHQQEVHERLLRWARWQHVGPSRYVSPMFRLYRPSQQWAPAEPQMPTNTLEALKTQKQVSGLPERNRKALGWFYVASWGIGRECREFRVSQTALYQLVSDSREMLL